MFYEIRHYRTRSGRRQEWVEYMDGTVIPFMVAQGMAVMASFVDEQDEDGYVWIRRFEDEAQRVKLYEAVYDSATWKQEIGPVVYSILLVEQSVVTRVTPTAAGAALALGALDG